MRSFRHLRRALPTLFALALALSSLGGAATALGQARRVPPQDAKKNKRPDQQDPKPGQQAGEEPPPRDAIEETEPVRVSTALVNIEAVVVNKKTKQIVTGLKKENFSVFEDGMPQQVTNFSTPEAPITVAMVMEYSNLMDRYLRGDYYEPGRYEVLRPMALFLSRFIKPPEDYVSVIAYDMRVTPITDFTNDPARINTTINLLLRNRPVSSEANLFDALKLVLAGGKADAVVLENSKERTAEYGGLQDLNGRRRAVFLISTGIDTFSKVNWDQTRKIVQNSGVPIYVIGTGNLFFKKYESQMSAMDGLGGATTPGRMTLYQAQNQLNTIAKESGGLYFPITFEGELPAALETINAMMRNQYSIGYAPASPRDGKRHKIQVKVDVNGDGQPDDKDFIVKAREYYHAPKAQ
jgi:Ca-activated chloride channel family protein